LIEGVRKASLELMKHLRDGFRIGLGSGSTMATFVSVLGEYVKERGLEVEVFPTSMQIGMVAEREGLKVLSTPQELDLAVDGADQVDRRLNLIKGGGGALLKEKVNLNASKLRFIIASEEKFVDVLNADVPIEVHPFSRNYVLKELTKLGYRPRLRLLKKGYPYITENGNLIFDTEMGEIENPREVEERVKLISGVMEVGIFTMRIDGLYLTGDEGYRFIEGSRAL